MKYLAALPAVVLATTAHAHEGHGLASPSHWHATDVIGFAVVAVAIAAVLWSQRGQ
jgi:uncharacterized membrane protein